MPAAHRLADVCTGHSCYPSRVTTAGSPDDIPGDEPIETC